MEYDLAGEACERAAPGLLNFGNTCYCNSVLQALYHCAPFRIRLLDEHLASLNAAQPEPSAAHLPNTIPQLDSATSLAVSKPRTLFGINWSTFSLPSRSSKSSESEGSETRVLYPYLCELFANLSRIELKNRAKRRSRWLTVGPKRLLRAIQNRADGVFSSGLQHDAHEFFHCLLNDCSEATKDEAGKSWVEDMFQGTLANETRCLACENITRREEGFIDLSVDIDNNTSLTGCLLKFSSRELLRDRDKFYCDTCECLQEAEKRMKIKTAPRTLVLQLKRFKYMERYQRHVKLSYFVPIPLDLRILSSVEPAGPGSTVDTQYWLTAVVVHVGSGPHQGHYITIARKSKHADWFVYDDDVVEKIADKNLGSRLFGSAAGELQSPATAVETAYMLFYQRNEDLEVGEDIEDLQATITTGDRATFY